MALRFMQIFVPEANKEMLDRLLSEKEVLGNWRNELGSDHKVLNLLVPAEDTETIMDQFEQEFGTTKGFHVVLFPVQAVLPRQEQNTETDLKEELEETKSNGSGLRVSREELHAQVTQSLGLTRMFVTMTALSAIVAAIGVMRDNTPVIIGAMVLAPLLGPNVAMSLATTLGDMSLLRRAFLINIAGSALAFLLGLIIGLTYFLLEPGTPLSDAMVERTRIHLLDLGLALASGAAGAMAFTRGISGSLIGVMVAVALMPPLVVSGMLLGGGHLYAATNAGLLFLANVICINLSGVGMFLWQGVRPRSWWETEKARKATRVAAIIWVGLLLLLIVIVYFLPKHGDKLTG